jgi:uncharacterized membrane protein YfcA
MTHDGSLWLENHVAIGVLYYAYSLRVRRGFMGAADNLISAFTGFGSFFLFLGFGYLDPFILRDIVLLQFLLLGLHSKSVPPA